MFTKTAKRVISLVLCLLMLIPLASVAFAVVDETEELVAARGNFEQGEGPVTSGYKTQYQFYSPARGNTGDETKYPVVFFIGKTRNTSNIGAELRETSFPLWSTEQYQKRFYDAGGAYIVLTRPQPIENSLGGIFGNLFENESSVRASLKAMIDDFVSKNETNIDKERIYLVSWDEGCKLAVRLAANNPNAFAALVMMAPTYEPTRDELTNLSNVPIWLFACEMDTTSPFSTFGTKLWDGIKNSTGRTYENRYTTFESFNTKGEQQHHETWEFAAYDMHFTGTFSGMRTVDDKGRQVEFKSADEGMISWMSKLGSNHGDDCTCPCHGATGWARILWILKWMLSMMLKIERNRFCDCGIAHW